MKAKDKVLRKYPEADAIQEVGTFVGGRIRWKVRLTPKSRKISGYGQRESWAWADACRNLGL